MAPRESRFVAVYDVLVRVSPTPSGGLGAVVLGRSGWKRFGCPDFSEIGEHGSTMPQDEAAAVVARISPGTGLEDAPIG